MFRQKVARLFTDLIVNMVVTLLRHGGMKEGGPVFYTSDFGSVKNRRQTQIRGQSYYQLGQKLRMKRKDISNMTVYSYLLRLQVEETCNYFHREHAIRCDI